MKHDWEVFGKDIAALIQTRGNRGCRGCPTSNSLLDNMKLVTPHDTLRLPLGSKGLPAAAATGNHKCEASQLVAAVATPATPVTPHFQQPSNNADLVATPSEWHAILAELKHKNCPDWLVPDRWAVLLSDAESFLNRWGETAYELGWTALDLFGVHPIAPGARFDVMGLILLLQGGMVAALTEEAATIRRSSNAILTYRRGDQTGAVCITRITP